MTLQQAFDLALQHHQAGRLPEAEALYRQILGVQPKHGGAIHYLGVIAYQAGRHELALSWIQQAIALDPTDSAAHTNLGEVYRVLGRFDEAIAAHRRALDLDPGNSSAQSNLAEACRLTGRLDEAFAACRQALELRPDYPEACNNLGNAFRDQGSIPEAAVAYRRALELHPGYVIAHYNLGVALAEMGLPDEAILACRRALELKADYPEAHNTLGIALMELGQIDDAAAAFRRALELQPKLSDAQFNYSNLLLLRGDFERGWPLYEARWSLPYSPRRKFPQPMWEGEPIHGRRVLIHAEQGLGDSIQFIRYARLIAEGGGEVIVECPRSLVELFRRAKGVREIVATGDLLPPFDRHVPMLSQPFVFKTTARTIPREVPYLFADEKRRHAWRERLGGRRARWRVGLAWQGNPSKFTLRKRHIALEKLLPLLAMNGIDFFSLQIGPGAEQIQKVSGAAAIADHTAHIENFADTAALMAELDLIISVDTAVAHLAGALARPVWTLLPFAPDWRWGLESDETPWYLTMRLFRQPALGEWASVIQRVADELSQAVATGSVGSKQSPC